MGGSQNLEITLAVRSQVQAANNVQIALRGITGEAQKAGTALAKAFEPGIIQNQQQLRSAIVNAGTQLRNFANTSQQVTGLSNAQAESIKKVAIELQTMGASSQSTQADLERLAKTLSSVAQSGGLLDAQMQSASAGVSRFGASQRLVNDQMGTFAKDATLAQRAGQGMVLSFSVAQAAAGNFQQALFGLGFSLLFVGKELLKFPVIPIALGLGLAGVAFEQLKQRFAGAPPVIQQVSKAMEELVEKISEARGFTKEFASEVQSAFQSGQFSVEEFAEAQGLRDFQEQLRDIILDLGNLGDQPLEFDTKSISTELATIERGVGDTNNIIDGLGLSFHETQEIIQSMTAQGITDTNRLAAAIIRAANAAGVLPSAVQQTFANIRENVVQATAAVTDARDNLQRQFAREDLLADLNAQAEAQIQAIGSAAQGAADAAQRGAQQVSIAMRRGVEDFITGIQRSFEDQQVAQRRATNARLNAIRNVSEVQIESVRRASDEEIQEIERTRDARIRALEEAKDRELTANKDRIDQLQEQERELRDTVQELTRQRQQVIRDAATNEAEIAALQSIQRRFGVDPAVERELALRQARLENLEEEQEALEEQIGPLEDQLDGIDDLITAERERADEIRANHREALAFIREQTSEAIDAARERADAEQDRIRDIMDADIEAARRQADARITQQRRTFDDRLTGIRRNSEDELRAISRAAAASASASRAHASAQQDAIRATLEEKRQEIQRAEIIRDRILPLLRTELRLRILAAQTQGILSLTQVLADFGKPGVGIQAVFIAAQIEELRQEIARIEAAAGFQEGGIVPGPRGKPRLIKAHGGEEIVPADQVGQRQITGPSSGTVMRAIAITVNVIGGAELTRAQENKLKRRINTQLGKDVDITFRSGRRIGRS